MSLNSHARLDGWFAVPGQDPRPLQSGCNALLDGRSVSDHFADGLPAEAADLFEIAARVYAIDRLVRRPSERAATAGVSWARSLWARLPVRDPALWTAHTDLLAWLTDDTWRLEFSQLPDGAGPLDKSQRSLFDLVPEGATPVLFSGGLDSAAGLAAHLTGSDAVAVSVATNGLMRHVQQGVLGCLRDVSPNKCMSMSYRVSAGGGSVEASQRSRGLLFLSAGTATAWALHQDHFQVCENGIGAINLPYLRSQFGSQATRSMHPRTLLLMERLAKAVSARPFRIDAPALTATKAQLIVRAPAAARVALASTVSCDTGFSARLPDHPPCGTCTSCLLRRQALHAAGRADLDAQAPYRCRTPDRGFEWQAMRWQVTRLEECLGQPDPWTGLVREFPEILDTAPLATADIVSLYRSYVQEWEGLEGTSLVTGQHGLRGGAAL
jgi:hypothetical protein